MTTLDGYLVIILEHAPSNMSALRNYTHSLYGVSLALPSVTYEVVQMRTEGRKSFKGANDGVMLESCLLMYFVTHFYVMLHGE